MRYLPTYIKMLSFAKPKKKLAKILSKKVNSKIIKSCSFRNLVNSGTAIMVPKKKRNKIN